MDYRILIVDDEPDILEFVGYNLRRGGYTVRTASNGREALAAAEREAPHLILLDVMMPELDGVAACRLLRSRRSLSRIPVIFLTAKGEEEAQIEAFEAGADDYINKPVQIKVLMSRIRAVLKRTYGEESDPQGGTLEVDAERYVVTCDGEELLLPRKEFNLLRLLTSKPHKVFSREEIYAAVWGSDVVVGDRTIDVHIRHLREKIGERRIVTVKGVGYKYEE